MNKKRKSVTIEEMKERISFAWEQFHTSPAIIWAGEEITSKKKLTQKLMEACRWNKIPLTYKDIKALEKNTIDIIKKKEFMRIKLHIPESIIDDLFRQCTPEINNLLTNETDKLNNRIKTLETENKDLKQIIRILDKGYKSFHITGKIALDFSKEASTMNYRDMTRLQIKLENIVKEVK